MRKYIELLLLIFICTACSDKGRFYSKEAENLPLEVKIERFDLDFMSMDSASLAEKYPSFYPLYVRNILEIPAAEVGKFKADSAVRSLFADVEKEYSSILSTIVDANNVRSVKVLTNTTIKTKEIIIKARNTKNAPISLTSIVMGYT